MFYLNSTLKFGIPPVLVFQLEGYYKVVRLLTGLTAQPKGTTTRWYSNKTSLVSPYFCNHNHNENIEKNKCQLTAEVIMRVKLAISLTQLISQTFNLPTKFELDIQN